MEIVKTTETYKVHTPFEGNEYKDRVEQNAFDALIEQLEPVGNRLPQIKSINSFFNGTDYVWTTTVVVEYKEGE